jgi:glycerophosphoryl diester phosphodiesterase
MEVSPIIASPMRTAPPGSHPFVVAHRAGNDLDRLQRAQALGLGVIEADLHLYAGRIEVRHLKTVGPLPVLWDRWTLAPPWAPRLRLERLLASLRPGTELMLDLKGRDRRLAALVAAALGEHAPGMAVTVCARHWPLLELLSETPGVYPVHSIGARRHLRALRRRDDGRGVHGVSIHQELLDAPTVEDLRTRADLLMTWPVQTREQVRRLVGWGVQGLITDIPEMVAAELSDMGVAV